MSLEDPAQITARLTEARSALGPSVYKILCACYHCVEVSTWDAKLLRNINCYLDYFKSGHNRYTVLAEACPLRSLKTKPLKIKFNMDAEKRVLRLELGDQHANKDSDHHKIWDLLHHYRHRPVPLTMESPRYQAARPLLDLSKICHMLTRLLLQDTAQASSTSSISRYSTPSIRRPSAPSSQRSLTLTTQRSYIPSIYGNYEGDCSTTIKEEELYEYDFSSTEPGDFLYANDSDGESSASSRSPTPRIKYSIGGEY